MDIEKRYPNGIWEKRTLLRMRGDRGGEVVKSDAFSASDASFRGIVLPRRENEEAACSYSIKQKRGRFVVFAKTVIGKIDDGALLFE